MGADYTRPRALWLLGADPATANTQENSGKGGRGQLDLVFNLGWGRWWNSDYPWGLGMKNGRKKAVLGGPEQA